MQWLWSVDGECSHIHTLTDIRTCRWVFAQPTYMYVVVHARRYGGVLMYGDIHVCGCTCT